MADSGWCPPRNTYTYTYQQGLAVCQESVASGEANGLVLVDPCFVYHEGAYPNQGGYAGIWEALFNDGQGVLGGPVVQWGCLGTKTLPSPAKANGAPTCGACVGDPINAGTGNVYRREEDFKAGRWLTFNRYYNSASSAGSGTLGQHWLHTYARSLNYVAGGTAGMGTVTITREDGRVSTYSLQSGIWAGEPDVPDALTEQTDTNGNPTGWTLLRVDTRSTELYNAVGQLIAIDDPQGLATTLTYSTSTTPTTVAPAPGYLITVTDPEQRTIQLRYNSSGLITTVIAPDGSTFGYGYNAGDLQTVTYSDTKTLTYLYNESAYAGGATTPGLLTGVIDESNNRYVTFSYNAVGEAISQQLTGGVAAYAITYNSDGSADVLDPLGTSRHRTFATSLGVPYVTSVNGACASCSSVASYAYDFNGMLNQTTDYNGNVTTYQHDGDGMETGSVEASTSATPRPIQTDWNDTFHVPTERRLLDVNYNIVTRTDWLYNSLGEAVARCDIDQSQASSYVCAATGTPPAGVRRWTSTYCTAVGPGCPLVGLLLSTVGPRTDLTQTTTYSYYSTASASGCGTPGGACYQPGDLYQVTDALGHVTTIASYDGDGRITRVTDANGVNSDTTYTPRGWIASHTVGGSVTQFTYMPWGDVQTVTDPDGVTTTLGYDPAHRLNRITDAQGNYVQYTLDAAGDKTGEQIYTAAGTLVRSLSRTFNPLGQITAIVDGLGHTVFNATFSDSYDGNSNLKHSADALGFQRQRIYDPLNRLITTVDNYNGTDTATQNTTTMTGLDTLDRVTGITDPTVLLTSYTYDGLSNPTALQSPDTGASSSQFDAAGDVLTHTDANGNVSTSTYDALNRLIGTTYADTTLNVAYDFDDPDTVTGCTSSSPVGRRTRVVEYGVTTTYCYDVRGNVTLKKQALQKTVYPTPLNNAPIVTMRYTYTPGNRLSTVAAPTGAVTSYAYNSVGRISGVQLVPSGSTSAPPTVVSNVTYLPFGPVSSYTLGNGQTLTRTYNANYQVTDVTSPALALHFGLDYMGDITAIGNAPGANPAIETYQYDPLYRLKSVTEANGTVLASYTYNETGDRLSKTGTGQDGGVYGYTPGTHQLISIGSVAQTNDHNGNTTGTALAGQTYGFGYNGRNRMEVLQVNGANAMIYTYNAFGQRVLQVGSNDTKDFAYDEQGHLVNESGDNREYVWMDDIPVATVDNVTNGTVVSTVNYVHADGLNTPRAVTNGAGTVIWQWAYQGNPFGEQQPTSTTGYVLNLRFAGQYYDAESGLMDWGFRGYEAATGRSPQSDPTGLAGGISTYAYALNNPLMYVDPSGLQIQQPNPGSPTPGPAPAPSTGPVPDYGPPVNDPVVEPEFPNPLSGPIEACLANVYVCGAAMLIFPTDAGGPQDEVHPNVMPFPKTARPIPNTCPGNDNGKEDRCTALYKSTLNTCAGLTGKKRFMCAAAALENYKQCMEEE
jgi:RHS repeat-associated protein